MKTLPAQALDPPQRWRWRRSAAAVGAVEAEVVVAAQAAVAEVVALAVVAVGRPQSTPQIGPDLGNNEALLE